jgi:hypothetical protein
MQELLLRHGMLWITKSFLCFELLPSSIPLEQDVYKLGRDMERQKGSHYNIAVRGNFRGVNYN